MKAKYHDTAYVQSWQRASPAVEQLTRVGRLLYSLPAVTFQIPFVALDVLFKRTTYGRPSWDFKFRALRLAIAHFIWATNCGTRPMVDVQSYAARSAPGNLKGKNHAVLVEVPPRPDKLFGDAIYESIEPETCPCFWQWTPEMTSPLEDTTPKAERRVMMYFVGGGMVQGHPAQAPLPWKMLKECHVPIFGVNFRKCVVKETAFPAALQDAIAAFYYLLDEGFQAKNICIMGDSGGAGIAITTLLYLRRHGLELPGSAILVSPFVDLIDNFQGDSELIQRDFINPEMLSMVSYQYTENRPDLRATLLSPARGNLPDGYTFKGLPKTMLVYGDAELFAPGIVRLSENMKDAGVDVDVVRGIDHVHDYPYYTSDKSGDQFYGRLCPFLEVPAVKEVKAKL